MMDGIQKRYEDTREYREKMSALKEREMSMVYFSPGNVVIVKHDISNVPEMVVKSVDREAIRDENGVMKTVLMGITCFWFTKDGDLRVNQFSTKDLIKIENR